MRPKTAFSFEVIIFSLWLIDLHIAKQRFMLIATKIRTEAVIEQRKMAMEVTPTVLTEQTGATPWERTEIINGTDIAVTRRSARAKFAIRTPQIVCKFGAVLITRIVIALPKDPPNAMRLQKTIAAVMSIAFTEKSWQYKTADVLLGIVILNFQESLVFLGKRTAFSTFFVFHRIYMIKQKMRC